MQTHRRKKKIKKRETVLGATDRQLIEMEKGLKKGFVSE